MISVPRCGVGKGAAQFMGGPERKGGTAVRYVGVVAIGIGNFGAESQLPLIIKSENVPIIAAMTSRHRLQVMNTYSRGIRIRSLSQYKVFPDLGLRSMRFSSPRKCIHASNVHCQKR